MKTNQKVIDTVLNNVKFTCDYCGTSVNKESELEWFELDEEENGYACTTCIKSLKENE